MVLPDSLTLASDARTELTADDRSVRSVWDSLRREPASSEPAHVQNFVIRFPAEHLKVRTKRLRVSVEVYATEAGQEEVRAFLHQDHRVVGYGHSVREAIDDLGNSLVGDYEYYVLGAEDLTEDARELRDRLKSIFVPA